MAGYDSPLGKKTFPGQPMREVTIPDESGHASQQTGRLSSNQQIQFDENALREFNARMNPQGNMPQIPTMTEDQAELEQQFRQARESKRLGRERLNDGAKRRIEVLIGMTRLTRTAHIENNDYVLQTLKSKELREAVVSASLFDGTVQSPFEIRKQLLARSITQVAGMDFSQFVGSPDLEAKLDAIEEFDHYLLGRLYDEYLLMVKEARDKYSVKDEAEVKEVMEDLKK